MRPPLLGVKRHPEPEALAKTSTKYRTDKELIDWANVIIVGHWLAPHRKQGLKSYATLRIRWGMH